MPIPARLPQSCVPSIVLLVDVSIVAEQQVHHVLTASRAGPVQDGGSLERLGSVGVGSMLQEAGHCLGEGGREGGRERKMGGKEGKKEGNKIEIHIPGEYIWF